MRRIPSPATGSGVSRLVPTVILAAVATALGGCERETTPPLIQVLSVSPREVEEGDRLAIEGVGFPEGKTAHVAFRGELHRPGVPAVRDVEVDVDAMVTSSSELELPMTASLEQLFAGAGDHATHTTFSGDVTVAFAARSTAAPPVAGTLHDTWLDVRPASSHRALAAGEADEGERTLAFLGIRPREAPVPAGGILIESIEPGSRAESARLIAGDVITEMNGVRVLGSPDLVATPGDRVAWLKIRRNGSAREELATVSLIGFRPPPAAALLGPVVILSLAAILVVLLFAPTPGAFAWLERHVAAQLRGARVRSTPLPRTRSPYVVGVGASAMFALLPFSHYLGLGDLDAGLLYLASLTALATLALFTGGSRSGRSYSVGTALRASGRLVSLGVPAAAAVVAVVMMTGSLRVEELVRAQAGWPWGWTLFRSPLACALFALASFGVLAGGPGRERPLPEAEAPACDPFASLTVQDGPRARVLFLATWVHRLVLSALAAALFLGGWQVPGVAPEQMEAHFGWTSVGAFLFVAKVWFVVGALAAAEWALPRISPAQATSLSWRWLAPLSASSVLLTTLWVAWRPGQSVEALVGAVMVALACATALHVVTRVRYFGRERGGELDPFL